MILTSQEKQRASSTAFFHWREPVLEGGLRDRDREVAKYGAAARESCETEADDKSTIDKEARGASYRDANWRKCSSQKSPA